MRTGPFFTVIIPTFNRSHLLREAVRSVLDQFFTDFELIVVDDHSTEDIRAAVESFGDSRLKYIWNNRSRGVAGARNTGIFAAKGDWTAFLDSDDVWLNRKLERLHEKIHESEPDTGLIYSGYAVYDFEKKQELLTYMPGKEGWIRNDLLYTNHIGTFSIVAIKTNILKSVGGCDERYLFYEDGDLYVRIAGIARVAGIPEKLTYVRETNTDKLSLNTKNRVDAYKLFENKYRKFLHSDPRLHHRIVSRVFVFSVVKGDIREMFRALPWTIAGAVFDPRNLVWSIETSLLLLYSERIKPWVRGNG